MSKNYHKHFLRSAEIQIPAVLLPAVQNPLQVHHGYLKGGGVLVLVAAATIGNQMGHFGGHVAPYWATHVVDERHQFGLEPKIRDYPDSCKSSARKHTETDSRANKQFNQLVVAKHQQLKTHYQSCCVFSFFDECQPQITRR